MHRGKTKYRCATIRKQNLIINLKTKVMKTRMYYLALLVAFLLVFVSCEQDNIDNPGNTQTEESIIPEKFGVDIPTAISQANFKSTTLKSASDDDVIKGEEIYGNLNYFIWIGESAAEIVGDIIYSISANNIQDVIELTYTSDDDGRIKRLVVDKNVDYDARTWDYMLTITDLASEGDADGGKAMQVFWNPNPIEGIALMKPYNIDRTNNDDSQVMYAVEYSALGNETYQEYMIVDIVDFPKENDADVFAMNNLKMFVGKNGDIVDVYGNSNHPMASFNPYNDEIGYNWAFVASGYEKTDIAVAEVGLPYSSLDATARNILLGENSIHNVLSRELTNYWVSAFAEEGLTLDSAEVAAYLAPSLVNAEAPGYFNANGFIQGGEAPNENYTDLEQRILNLTPYNPTDVSNLALSFK